MWYETMIIQLSDPNYCRIDHKPLIGKRAHKETGPEKAAEIEPSLPFLAECTKKSYLGLTPLSSKLTREERPEEVRIM